MTSTMRERFYIWYDQKNNSSSPEYPITTGELTDFIEQEIRKEREEIVEMVSKEFDRQSESCTKFGHEPVLYLPDTKRTIINTIKNRVL